MSHWGTIGKQCERGDGDWKDGPASGVEVNRRQVTNYELTAVSREEVGGSAPVWWHENERGRHAKGTLTETLI